MLYSVAGQDLLSDAVAGPSQRQAARADGPAPWDAIALRRLFGSALRGQQLIVVSNRAPLPQVQRRGGSTQRLRPSSGLVTAIEPVMQACQGTWVAHAGDDAAAPGPGASSHMPGDDGGYALHHIRLAPAVYAGYCDGFANAGLWPLCHLTPVEPRFVAAEWLHYQAANRCFAQAVVQQATQSDPIVLVQDYHLALVPALVREKLPRATIVSFWHVPWTHAARMSACPWLGELVQGLLGSDIVGFQTALHRHHFAACAAAVGHRLDEAPRGRSATRTAQARTYPISIAWPTAQEMAAQPSVAHSRRAAERRWDLPAGGKLLVGVDRFDYTKGLVERLLALEQLLLDQPGWRGRLRLVQVAAPTRGAVQDYAALRAEVWAQVRRINRRFGADAVEPIVLLDAHHDKDAVNALYRAADVCLVTSLHDGMNLVAKEFVAARDDERGVLLLSRHAGAADELHEALLVDPRQTAEVALALHRALGMPAAEQQQRMRALRSTVRSANVHRWAARMLIDVAALRAARAAERPARSAGALMAGA